jgi:hypothetical protein
VHRVVRIGIERRDDQAEWPDNLRGQEFPTFGAAGRSLWALTFPADPRRSRDDRFRVMCSAI